MSTKIISKLAPKNDGPFPTHEDIHGEGGFQVRADVTDRNSIPTANRKEGMWVKMQSDGYVYTLDGGITNSDWVVVSLGGGGGGSGIIVTDGGAPENIKANRTTSPSPIDNTKNGIVNLSSKTAGPSIGAAGNYATISGGDQNSANNDYSTIGGGVQNSVNGNYATIGGGENNGIGGATHATIGGGDTNTINNIYGTIGGGTGNGIGNGSQGNAGTVGGGNTNNVSGDYGTIGGGQNNSISSAAPHSTIGGGNSNSITNQYSVIAGGNGNQATGDSSCIAGGQSNVANGQFSAVLGGVGSTAGYRSSVCGGANHQSTGGFAFIGGGTNNIANGSYSSVCGGYQNTASGQNSHADGYNAVANKYGQYAHSSTTFTPNGLGEAQYTRVIYSGVSIGGGAVPLLDGDNGSYTFPDGTSYLMKISIVASEAGGANPAAFVYDLLVNTVAGTSTIVGGVSPPVFTRNTPVYTATVTIDGVITNQLNIDFTGISADVRAVATIEATELLFA